MSHLFAHFVDEDERIFFSLSPGDDALRWWRLNGGRPVLASGIGTGGARDPFLLRLADGTGFVLLATDLNTGADGVSWADAVRTGSRSILVWRSADLVGWRGPELVEVAPAGAGMAWAPEATCDDGRGDYLVYWSSRMVGRDRDVHNQIWSSRTRDFRVFGDPTPLVDTGTDTIDLTLATIDGRVHRVIKGDDAERIYHQVGSSLTADDFVTVAVRIGDDRHRSLEAPILVRARDRWLLLLDRYAPAPGGYVVLESFAPQTGRWDWVDARRVAIPPGTRHGSVLRITPEEAARVLAAFPVSPETQPAAAG